MKIVIPVAFVLGASAALAQVGRPTLGYLAENGRILPIHGIAPAAVIGSAVDPGRDLALTAVSPNQDFVLATAADTGELLLINPGASATVVIGAATGADQIFMSPGGSAAALWFGSVDRVQVVTGLPGSPSVRTVDTAFLETAPVALAVSDDGQWVAGAWADGVYAFGPEGQVTKLPLSGAVIALAFFHGRSDLAAATSAQVATVADVGGSQQVSVIFSPAGPESPNLARERGRVGGPRSSSGGGLYIAVSFDNRQAIVADRLGRVTSIDLATGASSSVECGCSPAGLFGMGGSIFRLTGASATPLKLFDASSGGVFVAPPAPPVAGGQQ